MGILKKVFKPVSKVLDKIIPNEVKPFLPYAAAFAPMIAPGIMGAFGNTMLSRAAIGGGLNIFGQLAQEGNEGDIKLLSAGLGALTGAMTGPGASAKFRSMQTGSNPIMDFAGERTALQKATDFGLEGLAKGSDIFAAGMKDPFSMAGLKAAALPAATATGDLMFAQAKRDQDEYDRMMEEEAAAAGEDSAARAFAIRQAMEAYGFSEDEIVDAIAAAGYKKGGRVGFEIGGLGALGRKMGPEVGETDMSNVFSVGDGLKIFIKDDKDKPEITGTGMQGDGEGGMEEIFVLDDGSRITVMDYFEKYGAPKNYKKGGRVGLSEGGADFGGITEAVETIEEKPKEFLVDKLKVTQMPGQSEMRAIIEAMYNDTDGVMPDDRKKEFYELYAPQMYRNGDMDRAEFEFIQTEILGKDMNQPIAKKDGGLMDLGGKEMDLRGGGFVPIGKKERADDVPARLSKNEFVMTADAVRAAGGGSVNEGAKRMYKVMNDLEARA